LHADLNSNSQFQQDTNWEIKHPIACDPTLPKVAILLCTYNGQAFLSEQLDSFASQKHPNWQAWASDDGSTDNTIAILETYQKKWGNKRLRILAGSAKGPVANFLSLTCNKSIQADYYSYSDQDDIWEVDKLQRAVNYLGSVPENVPALYCSRTRLVDASNQEIGFSQLFKKPTSFANALIQNIAGGNTMVFNNAARELLCEAGEKIDTVIHDWWVYMVVTGCGGSIFYDIHPSLRYRQHSGNLIGMNSNWAARLTRIRMLLQGDFKNWNNRNINALQHLRNRLTPENRQILDRFADARILPVLPRLIALKQAGIYRQTLLGNLGLLIAAVFNKI
jgi:glycosyltransferase involved in cell wall biosynthesis